MSKLIQNSVSNLFENKAMLSICITSYNRVNELMRCLRSIDADVKDVEIIVSEDKSPKQEEIRKELEEFAATSDYKLIANFNEENLGYDRNLAKLISLSNAQYILFTSDDDAFNIGALSHILNVLKEKRPDYMLTAYSSNDDKALNRKYNQNFDIESGFDSTIKYLYDGILFSGLIFRSDLVKNSIFNMNRFINTNYFQIYLLLKMLYHYKGIYDNTELINCIGDGENGYGTTELSNKDPLLADRNNIFSNLQFNKGLIKVIRIFDEEENTLVIKSFQKEYSLRSYRGLARARADSRKTLKRYWKEMKSLDIKICYPAGVYYRVLWLFGKKFSDFIFGLPRKILYLSRRKRT